MKRLLLALALLTARPTVATWEVPAFIRDTDGVAALEGRTDAEYMAFGMRRFAKHLQDPKVPVGVQVVPASDESMQGMWAYTRRCGSGYLIVMSDASHGEFRLSILAHELAHTLAFPDDFEDVMHPEDCGGHSPQWGIEWSRTFRSIWYDVDVPDVRLDQMERKHDEQTSTGTVVPGESGTSQVPPSPRF